MLRPRLLLLVLLVAAAPAAAAPAEAPPDPARAAGEVAAALETGDEAHLRSLAAREDPDPWRVAAVLRETHGAEAALRFARAAPRRALGGLEAWLEGPAPVLPAALRAALRAAEEALDAGRAGEAQGALDLPAEQVAGLLAAEVLFLRGRALEDLGRYGEAAATFRAAAEAARALGWATREADALFHAGFAFNRDGRHAEALAAYARRLSVETQLDSSVGLGRAHYALAAAYEDAGNEALAAQHLAWARTLTRESGDAVYLGKVLASEAQGLARRRDVAGALARAAEALAALDGEPLAAPPERFRDDPAWVAASRARLLTSCAGWALGQRDLDGMRTLAARSEAAAAGQPALVAEVRAFLALFEGIAAASFDGDEPAALGHWERARAHYREAGLREMEADTLGRLGALRGRLGDLPGGLRALEDAVAVLETIEARRARTRAHDLHLQAAGFGVRLGRAFEARAHAQAALQIARGLEDRVLEAGAMGALANVHRARAEHADGLRLFETALGLLPAGEPSSTRGVLLLGRSQVHADVGQLDQALDVLTQAEAELAAAGDRTNVEEARRSRADVLRRLGRPREALQALEGLRDPRTLLASANLRFEGRDFAGAARDLGTALARFEAAGDRRSALAARLQRGRALFFAGEREAGLAELRAARAEAWALDAPSLKAWAAIALAEAAVRGGQHAEAVRLATEGITITRSLGLDLAEGEAAQSRALYASLPQIGAAAAHALGAGHEAEVYTFLEEGRAATLLAALGGRRVLREATIPEPLLRREAEARAQEALAAAAYAQARRSPERHAARDALDALERARAGLRGAVADVQRSERRQQDLAYVQVADLGTVQALLQPEEALVIYAALLEESVAFVITHDGGRVVPLGPSTRLAALAEAVLGDDDHPVHPEPADALRQALVAPLGLAPGIRRVLVSPYGLLATLPPALVFPDHEAALVPSATTYALLRAAEREREVGGASEDVLAFGDPAYDPALAQSVYKLVRLDATAKEAGDVGDVVYRGAQATEKRFREAVGEQEHWRAVHLACHGFADAAQPTQSALALAADDENDGFVTALEVFRMRIPADLAVLSACDTGRGRVVEGEGLLGLTRAFMYAGSPRVLVSLWKVDDRATAMLMMVFYDLWNPQDWSTPVDAATALKRAQEYVRTWKDEQGVARYADERYWAAWVLWGLPD